MIQIEESSTLKIESANSLEKIDICHKIPIIWKIINIKYFNDFPKIYTIEYIRKTCREKWE